MGKYYLLLVAALLLGRLPTRILYAIADLAGIVAFYLNRRARRVVFANLAHVLPVTTPSRRRRRLARAIFLNAARYYADLIRAPHVDIRDLFERYVTIEGLEHLQAAREAGRGIILTSVHYGSPEIVFPILSLLGVPALALTEPLQPKPLSDLVHRLRNSHGQTFRPISLSTIKLAIRILKAGGAVAILADRDVQHTGICVQFCGAPARMPTGVIDLAFRTGATVLPIFMQRLQRGKFRIVIEPPFQLETTGDPALDTRCNVERLLTIFEGYLRRDPAQWIVLEPLWEGCEPAEPRGSINAGANIAV